MIQYFDNGNLACVDGISFRRDRKSGYFLSSREIEGKRKRLHVYIWEKENGKVPKGYEVHHIDKNKDNNELKNLKILTAEEHRRIHSQFSEERKEKARKNLIENAVPEAAKWHKSESGKEWHSNHAKEIWKNAKEIEYECTYCGKKFRTVKHYGKNENRFCCNKCKSAFRRKSGVDNIEKVCQECGKTYIENKYRKTEKCPSCRRKKR